MQPSADYWYLMARCLSGEASLAERDELMAALRENEMLQQQYEMLARFWQQDSSKEEEKTEITEQGRLHVARILQLAATQIDGNENNSLFDIRKKRRLRRRIFIPLTLLLIFSTTILLWRINKNDLQKSYVASQQKSISTPNGKRIKLTLPDGTSVWLNGGSKLSYSNDFTGPIREVRLEGEAYFDVVKNPAKPFIVHSGGINIKVLGTAFNVKSYPSDTAVETTLIRGLVQVTREYDIKQNPVILHPNEKLVIEKVTSAQSDLKLVKNDVAVNSAKQPVIHYRITKLDTAFGEDSHIETAWVSNRLAFRGDNFEQLAQKLERWYNIQVVFEDEKVKKLSFNGSFENETVAEAFTELKAAVSFNFKISGDQVFISSSSN